MRHVIASFVVLMSLCVTPAGYGHAVGSVDCQYFAGEAGGGCLVILNGAGQPFMAHDSAGMVVAKGWVLSAEQGVAMPAAAVLPLVVNVGGSLVLVSLDREGMWQ